MDEFVVPPIKVAGAAPKVPLPCPFTAQGMLQPSQTQPPPMFGPRGATIPPRHLNEYKPRPTPFGQKPGESGHRQKFNPRYNHQHRPRFQTNYNHKSNGERPTHNYRPNYFHQSNSDGTAVSREFYCETCDRDFRSADLLAEHREQHQRCGIDGCKFEGHEAMVSKHIQQQHSTGLYDKIKNLNTPEDIEKWREERRKRYPTTKNVELRQQIQEAKNKRGERLEDSKSRFGQKRDRRSGVVQTGGLVNGPAQPPQDQKKKQRKRKPRNQRQAVEEKLEKPDAIKEVITNGFLVMFQGTSIFKNYKRPRVEVKNALAGLLGDYGTDESDEEDKTEESEEETEIAIPNQLKTDTGIVSQKSDKDEKENIQHQTEDDRNESEQIAEACDSVKHSNLNQQNECVEGSSLTDQKYQNPFEQSPIDSLNIDLNDEDAPEEAIVQRVSNLPHIEEDAKVEPLKRSRNHVNAPQPAKKSKPTTILDLSKRYRNQNTMLEKLLQKDIRHERNVLLQCVRFVVDNNFFGIGQTSTKEPPT